MAGRTLLYVDQDRAYRTIIDNRSQSIGLSPYLAHSPQQALDKLAGRNGSVFPSPDILLCRYDSIGSIWSTDFVRQVATMYPHPSRLALLVTPHPTIQATALSAVRTMPDGEIVTGVLCKEGLSLSGIDDLLTRLRDGQPLPDFVQR